MKTKTSNDVEACCRRKTMPQERPSTFKCSLHVQGDSLNNTCHDWNGFPAFIDITDISGSHITSFGGLTVLHFAPRADNASLDLDIVDIDRTF